tara:strand:+ start:692 stop:1213 length:522 start_codon:yes stop_codon:yes gene_type:complete
MASLEENWTDESEEEPPPQEPPTPDVSEDDDDDELLEKPKAPPKAEKPPDDPNISKRTGRPKKKLSQKQLDALARGRATRDQYRGERKTAREAKAVAKKKQREANIVKKAVRIKKREVMEEAALELSSESSEDELEIKQVKRAVAKKRAKNKVSAKKKSVEPPAAAQPAFIFY